MNRPVSGGDSTRWLLEHAESTSADRPLVWKYLSDVDNWSDPPASFVLHGPYESGTHGATHHPDGEPVSWVLRAVRPNLGYTIESKLEGCTLFCEWSFTAAAGGGTLLRQRIGLTGPSADRHADAIRAAFGSGLPDGMKRIARSLDAAQNESAG